MAIAHVRRLLKHAIGLDASSIGVSAIERAVRERQSACGLADRDAYWGRVRASQAELQALIELVVVPETWFFRDPEAFQTLARVVLDRLDALDGGLHATPDRAVRVLSLPCSTGEEPYSIAMALLDAGVPARQFHVDGVDISERALSEARQGVYRKISFRGHGLDCRDRYFQPIDAGYRILDSVRHNVAFRHGNVLSVASLPGAGPYDAIFCRNVLIYFDHAARERAMTTVARLLSPEGLLFVGPAEAAVVLRHGFVSARMPGAHAFRKSDKTASERRAAVRRVTVPVPPRHPAVAKRSAAASIPRPMPPAEESVQVADGLETGIRLANQGRFAEAETWCEQYLRRQGPSAQVFYLLGLVRDAAGHQSEAVACYRKALYLDPHHHETLVHLALLMDTQSKSAEAQRLRSRALRSARPGDGS